MAEYTGFTELEVKEICKAHDMSFKEMQRWYDGYFFNTIGHVYSPNSVIEAVDSREFGNYWSRTETYESLMTYIAMDFDGLRQLIVDMLGGQRCMVDVESFQNDITSFHSADDVITLLIHMGYVAYDNKTKQVFIPKRASLKPALVVELKWDKSADGAIRQIKDKKYISALNGYKGDILLVGINYDKKSREHQCRIEKI